MSAKSKAQKLHNYTKFMELCRTSLSTKQFNAVSIVGMCGVAQISTNASKALIKEGYILKGAGRTFKASDKFAQLSVGDLMQMVTNYYNDWDKQNHLAAQEAQRGADLSTCRPIVLETVEQLQLPMEPAVTGVNKMSIILKWEPMPQEFHDSLYREDKEAIAHRAKVPGGWLLRMFRPNEYNDTITFIPDPKGLWD